MKIAFMEGTSITLLKMTVIKGFKFSLGAFKLVDFSRCNWIMYYKGTFTFGPYWNKSNVKDILSMCITILVMHSKKNWTYWVNEHRMERESTDIKCSPKEPVPPPPWDLGSHDFCILC